MAVADPNSSGLGMGDDQADPAGKLRLAKRRSGGGAVLVLSGKTVWVEISIPKDDELWDADVIKASWWLGAWWAKALGKLGVPDLAVHRRGVDVTRWSPLACFAGIGPGEVLSSGRKVVGISQRRTRYGSLFQCAVPLELGAEQLAASLALPDSLRKDAAFALAQRSSGLWDLGINVGEPEVQDAFLEFLP